MRNSTQPEFTYPNHSIRMSDTTWENLRLLKFKKKITWNKLFELFIQRANDLIRFGMLYRPEGVPRGKYCVNVKFIEKFLNNTSSVAEYYLKDKITKAVTLSKTRIYLKQVPSVIEIKKKYGETMTRYIHQPL